MSDVEPALDLSIVIPAYKEGKKIERDVLAAQAFLIKYALNAEIIVVDDGSPDDTALRAYRMLPEVPQLRVLSYAPNRGKGHALRFGISRARGRTIMFADAGLCVPFEIAILGIVMLESGMCDIAHGSRRMRGSILVPQPWLRRVGSRGFSLLIHTVIGIPWYISDTQCGFKLYKREVAQTLYGAIFTDGMMFDIEVVLRALRAHFKILEFPVLWSNDPDTRYDPLRGGAIATLRELWGIRLGLSGRRQVVRKADVVERSARSAASATEPHAT
jgi:dolichyl-phosphate beta-glucosyltransferase